MPFRLLLTTLLCNYGLRNECLCSLLFALQFVPECFVLSDLQGWLHAVLRHLQYSLHCSLLLRLRNRGLLTVHSELPHLQHCYLLPALQEWLLHLEHQLNCEPMCSDLPLEVLRQRSRRQLPTLPLPLPVVLLQPQLPLLPNWDLVSHQMHLFLSRYYFL